MSKLQGPAHAKLNKVKKSQTVQVRNGYLMFSTPWLRQCCLPSLTRKSTYQGFLRYRLVGKSQGDCPCAYEVNDIVFVRGFTLKLDTTPSQGAHCVNVDHAASRPFWFVEEHCAFAFSRPAAQEHTTFVSARLNLRP